MKVNKYFYGLLAVGLGFATLTQSCAYDAPFMDGDGEGTVRFRLSVNSELTRAEMDDDALLKSCMVYVSNDKGLLYKYSGADEIPATLKLKYGSYVAEAWAGDSVPASFIYRFYRGYVPFTVDDSGLSTVSLPCRVANVAVDVDQSSITDDMLTDWNITVFNSTGSLDFNAQTEPDSIGYFMMPKADYAYENDVLVKSENDGWPMFTNLRYRLTGTKVDGSRFEKEGLIGSAASEGKYVEHAHLYTLKFEYNPDYEQQGGSFIEIVIDESEIQESEVVGIYSRPSIKGSNFDISKQVVGHATQFDEPLIVKIAGFNHLTSVNLTSSDADLNALLGGGVDLIKIAPNFEQEYKDNGLDWEYTERGKEELSVMFVTFSPEFLNKLSEKETAYVINIHAEDGNTRVNDVELSIALSEAAVVKNIVQFEAFDSQKDPLSLLFNKAVISGTYDDEAVNPVLLYKKESEPGDNWKSVNISKTRTGNVFTVTLENLEPGTTYVYKGGADDWTSKEEFTFTTEARYDIPFGNMEQWTYYNKAAIKFPGTTYTEAQQFWDSGNHGSAVMSKTLTQASEKMNNTPGGKYSAELKSQYVGLGANLGAFAAGNLFMGRFGEAVGTSGAMLTFGKPYNGSHPTALSVWVSYTPGKVDQTKPNCPHTFGSSDLDHGQIYVALATEPIKVNTGKSDAGGVDAGTFMQYDTDPRIIGFGEKTWEGTSHGSATSLANLNIPIKWREGAKTQQPKYLIIVCSASKYGDYFTGSTGSIMYVDDFELLYDGELTFE